MHDEDQDNAEFLKQEFKRNIFQDIRSRCLCCANDDDDVTSRSGRDRCFQRDRTADRDESKCISFDALRFTIIDNQMLNWCIAQLCYYYSYCYWPQILMP